MRGLSAQVRICLSWRPFVLRRESVFCDEHPESSLRTLFTRMEPGNAVIRSAGYGSQ